MGDIVAEDQFGPYLVYERVGVGGMATVHRALERGIEGFERIVALKRLLPHLAEDASFIKSFVREAKLASLLNHVNIVQIYELGRVGTALLDRQVTAADAGELWTLQTSIFPGNRASIALHQRAGYRTLAVRERIARLDGVWRDTVLMERRS